MSTEHSEMQRFSRELTHTELRFRRAAPTATSRYRRFARYEAQGPVLKSDATDAAGPLTDKADPVFTTSRSHDEIS